MDPVSTVTTLIGLAKYLWEASEKSQQNQEECRRLAHHCASLLEVIERESRRGLSPDVLHRLQKLQAALHGLNKTLDQLRKQPMLKKMLWQVNINAQISQAYSHISDAVTLFDLGEKLDMHRFLEENEAARRADTKRSHKNMREVLDNEHMILEFLEVQSSQMQEAMMTLHKRLNTLEDTLMRQFLEKGMHAMQRRSGPLKSLPDTFVITSLDVLIHHDKKLGEGGFGQVFEAEWQGNRVAVKVLDRAVQSWVFEQEINVWKQLRHPNVLEFFGACSIADPPFMVCAYKLQGDAVRYLQTKPDADRLKLLHEASLGLNYLHQNSIIHGDLKASNILVDEHGIACLCDFSLSKIRLHTTSLKPDSKPRGTLRWMSPEQMSLGVSNKMTDVYSFSMTIYEIFSGAPPFANTIDSVLFSSVVDRNLRPPRPDEDVVIQRGLDDVLWYLIEESWAQDAQSRPTAAKLAFRLEDLKNRKCHTLSRGDLASGDPMRIQQVSNRNIASFASRLITEDRAPPTDSDDRKPEGNARDGIKIPGHVLGRGTSNLPWAQAAISPRAAASNISIDKLPQSSNVVSRRTPGAPENVQTTDSGTSPDSSSDTSNSDSAEAMEPEIPLGRGLVSSHQSSRSRPASVSTPETKVSSPPQLYPSSFRRYRTPSANANEVKRAKDGGSWTDSSEEEESDDEDDDDSSDPDTKASTSGSWLQYGDRQRSRPISQPKGSPSTSALDGLPRRRSEQSLPPFRGHPFSSSTPDVILLPPSQPRRQSGDWSENTPRSRSSSQSRYPSRSTSRFGTGAAEGSPRSPSSDGRPTSRPYSEHSPFASSRHSIGSQLHNSNSDYFAQDLNPWPGHSEVDQLSRRPGLPDKRVTSAKRIEQHARETGSSLVGAIIAHERGLTRDYGHGTAPLTDREFETEGGRSNLRPAPQVEHMGLGGGMTYAGANPGFNFTQMPLNPMMMAMMTGYMGFPGFMPPYSPEFFRIAQQQQQETMASWASLAHGGPPKQA